MTDNRRHPGHNRRQMAEAIAELIPDRPLTTRCAHCPDWTWTGTTAEALQKAAEHRATAHPNLRTTTHRKSAQARTDAQPDVQWRQARATRERGAA